MKHQTKNIDSFCFVTDYVANGSFASLKQGVTYRNKPDYAILVRVTDYTKNWNGNYVWVDKDSYDFLNKSSLKEGDLIIANVGETGKCFVLPNLGQPMTLGPNSILVRPEPEICNTKYLYYYFSSVTGQAEIEKISSATTQSKFNKTSFRKLEIPLPPFPIQQQIADTLDKADALRRKDHELLDKYDELAQAVFYEMFGDPVRNEKGWPELPFSETVTNNNNLRIPIKQEDRDLRNGEFPYYGATGQIDWINDYKFDGEYLLIAEDGKNLLIRKKPNAFRVSGKFWVNNHAHVLSYNGIVDLCFLEYYFNKLDLKPFVTGIDQFKLNKNNLDIIPVICPPIEKQKYFRHLIENIMHQKSLLNINIDHSNKCFDSLRTIYFK